MIYMSNRVLGSAMLLFVETCIFKENAVFLLEVNENKDEKFFFSSKFIDSSDKDPWGKRKKLVTLWVIH